MPACRKQNEDRQASTLHNEPAMRADSQSGPSHVLEQPGFSPVPGLIDTLPTLRRLATQADVYGGSTVDTSIVSALRRRRGTGTPLPRSVAEPMGEQLGIDTSALRIHTDPEAGTIAESIQAEAFTFGNNIYFSPGSYQPTSRRGQHLLAHELSHVAAQRSGDDLATTGSVTVGNASDPTEGAADRSADRVVSALRRSTHPVADGGIPSNSHVDAALRRSHSGLTPHLSDDAQRTGTHLGSSAALSANRAAPRGNGAIRRRRALTTKEIVSVLRGIPKFKEKMGEIFRDESVQQRIEETLRTYKAHIATKKDEDVDVRDAMMLSAALERIAHQFAEQLNDPSVTAELMPKMFEIFEANIGAKLKKKKGMSSRKSREKVLSLAKALSGGDPVSQYMHREIHKEVAAQQIIAMAENDTALDRMKVFELMTERWQAALSTYTESQQKATVKDPVGDFNRAEAHGEYSSNFFERTFGSRTPDWNQGPASKADSLSLTPDAQQMLSALKDEVVNPTKRAVTKPRDGLTEGQERHLSELERNEASLTSVDSDFLALFTERYNLTAAASRALLADVKKFLKADMKLTITVNLDKWFGTDEAPETPRQMFAPAVSKKDTTLLSTIFDKATRDTIDHIPTWNDKDLGASARGPSYLRFRHWKDQLMTGLHGLSSGEMASFGSGNITWDTVKGSDTANFYGTNYYGDLHFVLDRSKFGSRIVFTAGDHGEPRRDPLLAVHDLCGDSMGRTWLRSVGDLAVIDNVVNAVRSKIPLVGVGLKLEFQVFGGIDMLNDVTEVWLAGKHSAGAKKRVEDFYADKNVSVQVIGAAPPGTLEGGGGNLAEGLVPQLRPLVSMGAGLGPEAHKDLLAAKTANVKQGPSQAFHRELLTSCIVMSVGLEQQAKAILGHIELGDEAVLAKAKARLNDMWKLAQPSLDTVDPAMIRRVNGQIKRANDAVDKAIASAGKDGALGPDGDNSKDGDAAHRAPSRPPRPARVGPMRKRALTPIGQAPNH